MTIPAPNEPVNCRCTLTPQYVDADLEQAIRSIAPQCQIDIGCAHTGRPCTDRAEWILTLRCGCPTDRLAASCTPHKVLLPRLIRRIDAVCDHCLTQPTVTNAEPLT